jgi:mannose-6-phosphate isomerase-like protein (cupin superfamily)
MPPRKIALLAEAGARIARVWDPHVAADVNDAQIKAAKAAKFGGSFGWHAHPAKDEAFLILEGRIAVDVRDGAAELREGDLLTVPRGTEHRPRALTHEPVVLMSEPAATLNTGDARSDLTVADLKRL